MHNALQVKSGSLRLRQLELALALAGLLVAIPAGMMFWLGKTVLALTILTVPVTVLLIAYPRVSLYLFLISISVYLPYRLSWITVHPFDIGALLVVASVAIDFLIRKKTTIHATSIDKAFIFLIVATFTSAIFAHQWQLSVVPVFRIILVYFVFRAVYMLALDIGIHKLVMFYVLHVFALALVNSAMFVVTGGSERIFGPAWLGFESYSMTALPVAILFLILSDRTIDRWGWSLVALTMLFAIFGTLSRGPLVTVVLAVPIVMMAARKIRSGTPAAVKSRSFGKFALMAAATVTVVALLTTTLLTNFLGRIDELILSLSEPQGSIALRLVLWDVAIEGFKSNPLTGIGIGNFKTITELFPSARLDMLWVRVSNMSAHNVFLQYLCETGVFGTVALCTLAWCGIKESLYAMKWATDRPELIATAGLFVAIAIFSLTLFYMRVWTWGQEGYIMAVLFGLTAAAATRSRIAQLAKASHPNVR